MRTPCSLLGAFLLAMTALPAVSTHAQDASAQPSVEPRTIREQQLLEAKQHFELGLRAFAARDFRAAIREFELASAQAPSAELWFDLARAHQELAEYDAARVAYERYLRDRVDAKDAAEVRERIAELTRLAEEQRAARSRRVDTGSLRVQASVPAALIMLDGRLVGRAPLREPLSLRAGAYRLDVVDPAFLPFHAEVQIEPGMLTAAYADLTPQRDVAAVEGPRRWTWVAVGLSAALGVTSGAFAIASITQQRADDDRSATRWADRADLALGGALLCAVSATLLYFIEGGAERAAQPRAVALANRHSRP